MTPDQILRELDRQALVLDDRVGQLSHDVLALDEGRSTAAAMATRCDEFADRMGGEYPGLAGPATRMGELFRELDERLGRLSKVSEELVVLSDRMVAATRA